MKTSEAVASRIRELLKQKNMTQYGLCKKMAIHLNTLTNIMTAKNKSVNLNTIILVCRGLEVTVEHFFSDPIFESEELVIE